MFYFLRRLPDEPEESALDCAAVITAVPQTTRTVNGEFRLCKPIFRFPRPHARAAALATITLPQHAA